MNDKTLKVLEYNSIVNRVSAYCVSDRGEKLVNNLRPQTNKELVIKLLQETDEAVRLFLTNGDAPLSGFFDISPMIRKARMKSVLDLSELLKIATTLRVIKELKNYGKDVGNFTDYIILYAIFDGLDSLNHLEKEISRCVLSPDELSDRASEELFTIRKQIQRKNLGIREKLNKMISSPKNQKHLQEPIITIRQERFVIPVKQEYRQNVPGIIHDQSSSGATLFIEPMDVVELNNDLRKLKLQEIEEIERILIRLTEEIDLNSVSLEVNLNGLIQLDVIFAKSKYALEINGRLPAINDELILNIKKARHPLIPPDDVVASDISIGEDYKTIVITGPNTGGKTVTLKTVGLLCLMMQTGLFVPCNDGSSLCIYEYIYADIGDEQSIEQSLSTFSSHMKNIVEILSHIKGNTLVLLDELGAGTDPTEGAALAMAILDYLEYKENHVIVTTHYSELKQYAMIQEGVINASVEFNVHTLSPTYRLMIGVPGKSNAFEISSKLGLSEEIIKHSKKYLTQENIRFEDVLKDIEDSRLQTQHNYEQSQKKNLKVSSLLLELEEEKKNLEELKNSILMESKDEALKIIENANNEAQLIIKEMQNIRSNSKVDSIKELEKLKRDLKEKEKEYITEKNETKKSIQQRPFAPGDAVKLLSLNQKGYVLDKPKDDGTVMIQVGIMKSKVSIEDLRHTEDEQMESIKSYSRRAINNKSKYISNRIDVRGKNSEEMLLEISKYIDDAIISNLPEVTIIHGKGTGILRSSLRQYLKGNPRISDFRTGEYNEGGTGVTIVTLK